MAALSLSQSGQGKSDFTLDQARELASDLGFVKPDVPHSAPIIKRVDMDKFFKAYGVNSLSAFKKSFAEESLPQPGTAEFEVYATQKSAAKAAAAKGKKGGMNADGELELEPTDPIQCEPIPSSRFEELSANWEKDLKWKLVQRPGGAFIQSNDWYRLYAAISQAREGDVKGERPMWDETGNVNYNGRAKWDAWKALKGLTREKAVEKFCRVYAEAITPDRAKMNFSGPVTLAPAPEVVAAAKAAEEAAAAAAAAAAGDVPAVPTPPPMTAGG